MANTGRIEGQLDVSGRLKQTINNGKTHKINAGEKHGTAKPSDFNMTESVEVPARASRERVNPAEAAKLRRTPLIDVTPIVSPTGRSHIFEPPPSKL